ncbi:alpha/beta fold hydrolase [Streptomyces sp. 796.1]|uniref:alpha/beta fold hydrolase n=1 Tax=Streptomyces sp. 796.1 TaxID=3163029 RepID=UPI0039C9113A
MVVERDLEVAEGRRLHVYDTGAAAGDAQVTVFWHHGTPNVGAPPVPLFLAGRRLGVRWISYDRPGYGGSTPRPGRSVAAVVDDVVAVADALGVDRFAAMGHSGGGPHALACGALLGARVVGVVSVAGLAPFGAAGIDWFAGMASAGAQSLRAAVAGRAAKEEYEAAATFDPQMFTPADHAALAAEWSWFEQVVEPAMAAGPGGLIDDDLAYVAPWGFDPEQVVAPALLLHGDRDRIAPSAHARWLADRCPTAELRIRPDDGHISVLAGAEGALAWLAGHGAAG